MLIPSRTKLLVRLGCHIEVNVPGTDEREAIAYNASTQPTLFNGLIGLGGYGPTRDVIKDHHVLTPWI